MDPQPSRDLIPRTIAGPTFFTLMSLKIYRAAVQNGRAQSGDVCETYEREEVLRDARPQIARSFFVYTGVQRFPFSFLSFSRPSLTLSYSRERAR